MCAGCVAAYRQRVAGTMSAKYIDNNKIALKYTFARDEQILSIFSPHWPTFLRILGVHLPLF